MQLKLTSLSSVARSFIVVAACVAAPSVALADTGGVLVWGFNNYGQCNIPASANSGVSAIAGGTYHIIALKDGAVLAWGYNQYGECNIPDSANSGVSAIAGGEYHTIALKGGAVLAWGAGTTNQTNGGINWTEYGQCIIPASANSGVSAIAGGALFTIALKGGAVLAWGYNGSGQCTIPDSANSGVSAIAGGSSHTIALKAGAVLAWGYNGSGQCTIPASANSGVTSIAGSLYDTIALARDAASYQAEIATLTSQNTALTSENVTLDSENTALTAQLNCGDLNGDGEVNGADVGLVLINHGPCPPPEKAPQFKGARNDSPR